MILPLCEKTSVVKPRMKENIFPSLAGSSDSPIYQASSNIISPLLIWVSPPLAFTSLAFLPASFLLFWSMLLWQGSTESADGWQGRCLIFIRIANNSEWMPDQIRRRGERRRGKESRAEERRVFEPCFASFYSCGYSQGLSTSSPHPGDGTPPSPPSSFLFQSPLPQQSHSHYMMGKNSLERSSRVQFHHIN